MRLRLKRHYPLLVLLVLTPTLLVLGLGSQRIIAYTVAGGQVAEATTNYTNGVAVFDDTVVHTIQLLISEADYQQMITTYQETGEKDYFHADVVIDGVRVNDVGVRLKGNASLRTALGGRGNWGGDDPRMQPGEDGLMPQWDPENRPGRDWPGFPGGGMPNDGERPEWPGQPGEGQMPEPGEWPVQPASRLPGQPMPVCA